ncbi:hypothetical protein I2I11_14130 [Pontibacter sp. 172403-2]|uniref:hypothetical protein n=1 Tax=Pontibacter rufus TaxID=2791028 RepID=UPI0018B00823|nr:hypothetical protein [Pontibacter sp. 172403-2]MBF9254438.1 hypothetical protein [Pontibacter sp. 172403-2]
MEDLTEYLEEDRVPLEEKVKQYLAVERNIRLLEIDMLSMQQHHVDEDFPQNQQAEAELQLSVLMQRYEELQQEIIALLPGINQLVEIDLGYGPSSVGYFTVDHETYQPLDKPVLRVVH